MSKDDFRYFVSLLARLQVTRNELMNFPRGQYMLGTMFGREAFHFGGKKNGGKFCT